MTFGTKGALTPLLTQVPRQLRLKMKSYEFFAEATPLQKRLLKKLFTVKVEKSRNFYKSEIAKKLYEKIKNQTHGHSI